jgi:hypothetical protein
LEGVTGSNVLLENLQVEEFANRIELWIESMFAPDDVDGGTKEKHLHPTQVALFPVDYLRTRPSLGGNMVQQFDDFPETGRAG